MELQEEEKSGPVAAAGLCLQWAVPHYSVASSDGGVAGGGGGISVVEGEASIYPHSKYQPTS